uniref:apocytochrome f n=1 Tax=Hypnea pseudomusciformis TaxID=1545697 RepID=UPI0027DA1EDF|nr:apocytochrome f [Hypnea pseudomusciformis]WCH55141.1 apocytochrome f [Hypnea pseudomusciformis]WCH56734.1 apocytochrome f [Hypnea pseudomusciformis]
MKLKYIKKIIFSCFLIPLSIMYTTQPTKSSAFPIYAQQAYENPREATGRIVCANCHLAQKKVEIEAPQSVLPNSVFETIVKIPYNTTNKQILGNGQKGPLNVGAVLILPEGFKLAPKNLLSEELKEKTKNIYIQPYSTSQANILVVGPVPGDKNQEIVFPILSPDPSKDKNVHFIKYPIYVGGNRGRGQIYPTGDKSNNNVILSSTSGTINQIDTLNNGNGYNIYIEKNNGESTKINIPNGLELNVKEGSEIIINQNLTKDPNAGGFGQNETEIVLQSPVRIQGMIIFFFVVTLAQIFFVLKKKQWEKVQAAEMNF